HHAHEALVDQRHRRIGLAAAQGRILRNAHADRIEFILLRRRRGRQGGRGGQGRTGKDRGDDESLAHPRHASARRRVTGTGPASVEKLPMKRPSGCSVSTARILPREVIRIISWSSSTQSTK